MIFDGVIIGAGLSGMYTAFKLMKKHPEYKILVLEASDRIGGRLKTQKHHDLGATWSWPHNDSLLQQLIAELGIKTFSQNCRGHCDLMENASEIRLEGGSEQLVLKMAERLEGHYELHLRCPVQCIRDKEIVYVECENGETFQGRKVVVAVPPKMILQSIVFDPPLPQKKVDIMKETPTWMAGASKVVIQYKEPFWRKHRNFPVVTQDWMLYDASQDFIEIYALCLFYAGTPKIMQDDHAFQTLEALFGPRIREPEKVFVQNWIQEPYVCENPQAMLHRTIPLMHDAVRIGHLELRKHSGSVHFASTETEEEAGHMEGALVAAERVLTGCFSAEVKSS